MPEHAVIIISHGMAAAGKSNVCKASKAYETNLGGSREVPRM